VTIDVNPVNDAPVAVDDNSETEEDQFRIQIWDLSTAAMVIDTLPGKDQFTPVGNPLTKGKVQFKTKKDKDRHDDDRWGKTRMTAIMIIVKKATMKRGRTENTLNSQGGGARRRRLPLIVRNPESGQIIEKDSAMTCPSSDSIKSGSNSTARMKYLQQVSITEP
jgi:hypothetical protein